MLDRIRGSHHMIVKQGAPRIDVVVHGNVVKIEYLKDIAKKLGLKEE